MNRLYTIFYSIDNFKDANFLFDSREIPDINNKKNLQTKKMLDSLIVSPRNEFIKNLFEMIENRKI